MDDKGFIVIYRSMKKWEWYQDTNTKVVFLHLLLNANWDVSRYKGYEIPRGGLVIGLNSLSKSLKLSVQQVRTALDHLKSTNEITIKTTNRFSIVTIVNWEKYQGNLEELTNRPTHKATNNQQTTNKQLTTEEQYNNITIEQYKEKNTKKESPKRKIIPPKLEWVKEYCQERKNNVDAEKFFDFYESKGWKVGKERMKDWEASVRTWEREKKPKSGYDLYRTTKRSNYDFEQLEYESKHKWEFEKGTNENRTN